MSAAESTPRSTPNRPISREPLKNAGVAAESLVDAAVVASHLGVSRDYVYEHALELGAVRLGAGPRARLRFRLADVDARLTACSTGRGSEAASDRMVEPKGRRRARSGSGSGVELLPIRGRDT